MTGGTDPDGGGQRADAVPGAQAMALTIAVVRAPSDPDVTLLEEVTRRTVEAGGVVLLNWQREPWAYDESVYGSGRVFAACAMDYEDGTNLAVLAMTGGDQHGQVAREDYERAGGRDLLCGIVASVHGLVLDPDGRRR